MAEFKRLLAQLCCDEKQEEEILSYASACGNDGADGLVFVDSAKTDEAHEFHIGLIRKMARAIDIPIFAGGRVKRLEDVKKYLYAGAKGVFLDASLEENVDMIKEAADRFGSEKIFIRLNDAAQTKRIPEYAQLGASMAFLGEEVLPEAAEVIRTMEEQMHYYVMSPSCDAGKLAEELKAEPAAGVVLVNEKPENGNYMEKKQELGALDIPVDILKSSVSWGNFKTNSDGLVPVIVQDFKTFEVLMLAYMNEQAFADTLRTGKMHYYSRSRQSQWLKGETSGHFQYVKSLHLDCDNDTILAKVHQIGAACHTGSRSCFFQTLAEKEYRETNPLKVFEDVFSVIQDRKVHPKEGSYTNYLFDKGIDKILKKVGEEATEIVIAAKNPDPEEIKYEISDFLYHVMVLMAERGVTWEDITEELANR
ncbi:bifunctional phosphoribosyl-AMP cyclohydrolase/phosphoribosyl-ATP diphosphatase HisIE [Ventrimonas sp. CLA-AP-H27]|uniref:Histidine biosynthesis bifunctional protein HisIE n=2 Tax=Ventrimonas faecis TaxID=3133170 RepID=A0ABV1HHR5_9FIRM